MKITVEVIVKSDSAAIKEASIEFDTIDIYRVSISVIDPNMPTVHEYLVDKIDFARFLSACQAFYIEEA